MADRTGAPISKGFMQAIGDGFRGFRNSFFGPGESPPEVKGPKPDFQQNEYEMFYNGSYASPQNERRSSGVTLAQLRDLADACEVLRAVIETRKDTIEKMNHTFSLKPIPGETSEDYKARADKNDNVKKVTDFFKKPDGENRFSTWMRMLIEEALVIDRVCVYKRPLEFTGGVAELMLVDGATIKRYINDYGMTVRPYEDDGFAYGQYVHGELQNKFTMNEMKLFMRNRRVSKQHSYSPVEQVVVTVNKALKRDVMQLAHYTDGNMPFALLSTPKEWGPDQIKRFQTYWDALLSGNQKSRSRAKFIPDGVKPIFPQAEVLKDEFDEWLARIICYVFSVANNPFIKNLNRSTSEQSRDQADEEGLFAWKKYTKEITDEIIEDWLLVDDVELSWIQDKPQDSLKQAQIDEIDVRNGIKSIDEIRESRGLHPIGVGNGLVTSRGFIALTKDGIDQSLVATQVILTDADSSNDPPEAGTQPKPKTPPVAGGGGTKPAGGKTYASN